MTKVYKAGILYLNNNHYQLRIKGGNKMVYKSLIGESIPDFKVNAYHNKEFVEVTNQDMLGHWSVLFFYPADFTFV